MTFTDSHFPVT